MVSIPVCFIINFSFLIPHTHKDISGNAVEDITCISSLPHLLTIKADHNRLTSAHLMELQYLQIASFAHNHITSTDGIAHPMLEVLDLSCKFIKSVCIQFEVIPLQQTELLN